MHENIKAIRKNLKALEKDLSAASELREWAKTDGGRITEFGKAIIDAAYEWDVPQAVIARVLDVSPAAISRRYGK